MKVRMYCDLPSSGVRLTGSPSWSIYASNNPPSGQVPRGYTRIAFDVDFPPNLVLPAHDLMAPAGGAAVLEEGDAE